MNVTLLAALDDFNMYGLLIGLAMLGGIVIAFFLAKKRGYHDDLVFIVAVICIPCAIIGARLYYIIFSGRSWTFLEMIGWKDGRFQLEGLAIYGGVIGGMLGSIAVWAIFKRKKDPNDRVSFMQMFDLFFILILLGQAIGRWGNYFNQEAYGQEITNPAWQWFPIAVNINGIYYQATFFYEFFFNIIGCGIMLWLYLGRRKSFDGFIFSFYGIWYGIVRLFIEGLRSDSLWLIDGVIRVSQVVSILFILAGLAVILVHVFRARSAGKKIFIFVPQEKLDGSYFGYDKSRLSKPPRVYSTKKKKAAAGADEDEFTDGYGDSAEDISQGDSKNLNHENNIQEKTDGEPQEAKQPEKKPKKEINFEDKDDYE